MRANHLSDFLQFGFNGCQIQGKALNCDTVQNFPQGKEQFMLHLRGSVLRDLIDSIANFYISQNFEVRSTNTGVFVYCDGKMQKFVTLCHGAHRVFVAVDVMG